MRSVGDVTSAKIFEDILADEEHHVDYLETQLHLHRDAGRAAVPAERHRAPERLADRGRAPGGLFFIVSRKQKERLKSRSCGEYSEWGKRLVKRRRAGAEPPVHALRTPR